MLEKIRAKKKRGFFRLIFLKIQLKQDARAACWGIYGQIPVFVILPVTARLVLRANSSFPHFARNRPHYFTDITTLPSTAAKSPRTHTKKTGQNVQPSFYIQKYKIRSAFLLIIIIIQ